MTKVPLYQTVYQDLKNLIRTGEYEVGDFLPAEGVLEEQYDVSRTTVRKVINMLVSEGYVEVKQGRGTRVMNFHSTQQLNGITSISETLRNRGVIVVAKSVYIDVVYATAKTAERLHVEEKTPLYRLQRVTLGDGEPVAIMENFIRCDLAPGLQSKAEEIHSLYKFLETNYQLHLDVAKDIISAKNAEFSESEILHIHPGDALLTLRRVTYIQGNPITYDKIILRADKYQFENESFGRF